MWGEKVEDGQVRSIYGRCSVDNSPHLVRLHGARMTVKTIFVPRQGKFWHCFRSACERRLLPVDHIQGMKVDMVSNPSKEIIFGRQVQISSGK